MISVHPDSHDEDQDAIEVVTPAATYFYHTTGGGFSSLVDVDGNDWLGYQPGGGPAGEYRGIPNMVFRRGTDYNNHFHPGHGGVKASKTRIVSSDDEQMCIESAVDSDRWRIRWTIDSDAARLTVLDTDPADPGFWFLYEGTPGGRFSMADRCLRSDGKDLRMSKQWEGTTATIDWVAFRVPRLNRSLLIQLETDVVVPVSYYPMKPMTVFGFGRRLGSADNLFTSVPLEVSVRLVETADKKELASLASSGVARG